MPIENVRRGKNIFREALFGSGDILICKAKESPEHSYDNMVLLMQDGKEGEIGRDAGYAGFTSDEIPFVSEPISLRFEKSSSVRVLIEDLLELESNLISDGK